jgi:regulatory protein
MRERSVYDQALTLLEYRARSVAELRRKLLDKGNPAADVDEVIEKLKGQHLLDDADFARQFARNKILGPGVSRFRIVQELARKGVAREVAESALDGLHDEDGIDSASAIHRVAMKKWARLSTLDDFTRRRRLYAFLARRGFSPDEISAALREVDVPEES